MRGRPESSILVRAPVLRKEKPARRDRIVDALAQILLADLERQAVPEARVSPSRDKVSSDRIEEAKAS